MLSRLDVLRLLALMTAAVIGGCSLPAAGPHDWDIVSGQYDPKNLVYALVRVTPRTVDILSAENPQIAGEFPDRRGPEAVRFGVGDVLGITIFESGAGGLFTAPPQGGATPGNYITLPNQAVDDRGNISVPYAGTLRAKGRTAIEVQQAIVSALKDSALKPQALVSLIDQRASSYTVLGEVRAGGRYAVSASGERLLEAIARAGGLSGPGNGSWVLLEREGRRALVPFGAILDVQANNIYVRAHDIIYVFNEPQTFLAFGAVGTGAAGGVGTVTINSGGGARGGQYTFDAWRLTLSEALAKTSGLVDSTANPSSVFLYRGETRYVAELLGVDVSKFDGPIIPIIYNVDLRNPAGYFLTSKFEMRNKDVIYVSNASAIESGKVMAFMNQVLTTATNPISAATAAYALKTAITTSSATATIIGVGTP
jgi:polysaccharide export outer membrane protein